MENKNKNVQLGVEIYIILISGATVYSRIRVCQPTTDITFTCPQTEVNNH
jgi:hypothetical protein